MTQRVIELALEVACTCARRRALACAILPCPGWRPCTVPADDSFVTPSLPDRYPNRARVMCLLHMMQTKLSLREINRITRDGGNGRNVYHNHCRVTRAKTERGDMLVRHLNDGRWYIVCLTDRLEVL